MIHGFSRTVIPLLDRTCHTACETFTVLNERDCRRAKFSRVIFRYGDKKNPPRSYDLTCLDFCPWGHLKTQIFTRPANITALKVQINTVSPQVTKMLLANFVQKSTHVLAKLWRPFTRYFVSYVIPEYTLYKSMNISLLCYRKLCVLMTVV